ncbi:uncharacterized protein CEXT_795391 [Caerostris extrusa]|uniref:Uncharacterized protein n=1 Tax=Caerostris extrusa TaxID=172846 RepID=A0AAV4QNU9_CAEEX|nr:uncharacterized protein CEXT_795391 [Caerostris extrusa]
MAVQLQRSNPLRTLMRPEALNLHVENNELNYYDNLDPSLLGSHGSRHSYSVISTPNTDLSDVTRPERSGVSKKLLTFKQITRALSLHSLKKKTKEVPMYKCSNSFRSSFVCFAFEVVQRKNKEFAVENPKEDLLAKICFSRLHRRNTVLPFLREVKSKSHPLPNAPESSVHKHLNTESRIYHMDYKTSAIQANSLCKSFLRLKSVWGGVIEPGIWKFSIQFPHFSRVVDLTRLACKWLHVGEIGRPQKKFPPKEKWFRIVKIQLFAFSSRRPFFESRSISLSEERHLWFEEWGEKKERKKKKLTENWIFLKLATRMPKKLT